MRVTVTWETEEGAEIEYEAEGTVEHFPGKFYGPPEMCYESETNVEVTAIYLNDKEVPWNEVPDDLLARAEDVLIEAYDSYDGDDEYEPEPDAE